MLCSDLLLKDMETFKHDYDACTIQAAECLNYEKLYQEALAHLAGNKGSDCRMGKVYQEAGCIAEIQAV